MKKYFNNKNRITKVLLVTLLASTIVATGCNNKEATYQEPKQHICTIKYLYNKNNGPVQKVSNEYFDSISVSANDISKIPNNVEGKEMSLTDKQYYSRVSKEMSEVENVLNKYIPVMYLINPNNIEEQCTTLKNLSFDKVRFKYKDIINEVKQKKINRKYIKHNIDKAIPIDIQVVNHTYPGKIIYGTVNYNDENNSELQDNIEIRLINVNKHWQVVDFKVND